MIPQYSYVSLLFREDNVLNNTIDTNHTFIIALKVCQLLADECDTDRQELEVLEMVKEIRNIREVKNPV